MRSSSRLALVSALLAVIGSSPLARAQEPSLPEEVLPAYAPLRTVGIVLETGQALFWDERAGEYRLGRIGEEVYGWKIVALEPARVIVAQAGVQDQLALEAPPTSLLPRAGAPRGGGGAPRELPTVIVAAGEAPGGSTAPAAPSAPSGRPAAPATLPEALAPPASGAGSASVAPGAPGVAAAAGAPTDARPAPVPSVSEEHHSIPRAELDRELADFGRLKAAVQVRSAAGGGVVISRLLAGSWPAKIGLREGDVVRAVADERLSSLDDAARIYARLRTSRSFTVELDRAGRRVVLRYQVT